jgi:small subunit ribosomal protein S18
MARDRDRDRDQKRSGGRQRHHRRRVCRVCERGVELDYKRPDELKQFMNRLGKILPKRATRLCAKHQRQVAREINRARKLALLPYTTGPTLMPIHSGRRRR